jgi:two-component system, OmpR family, sensor histidine kinase BaeS
MTDGTGRPAAGGAGPAAQAAPGSRGDTLGLRLALAFLAVALAAVALLAGLTAIFAAADVSNLASRQRTELTRAVAVAAGAAWDRNNSWASADLSPVLDLAARTGADVRIRDQAGQTVASSPGFAAQKGPETSAPVVVRGQQTGKALVRFTGAGLGEADNVLRTALLRAIAGAAGLAALLALLTGLAVARRITRPVSRLIGVTRAMAGGDRAARAGEIRGPAELRELAAAFDQMANTLDRQEQIRRDLVADVAHELRTPVAVLQAGHEALVDGIAEPTPAELGSMRDEVLRLARMVNDLQTLAAADAAALRLNRQPCDLAETAGAAADSQARRFEAAGIALDQQLTSVTVLADPHWLHQIVTNLLTNALKFTPAGGRVVVRTGPATPPDRSGPGAAAALHQPADMAGPTSLPGPAALAGPTAMLQVTDTGVGISADDLPHIFDRFWRGRGAAQISGSGIGLAIAAELAQAHGGRLTASSEPGRGTQFTLLLPAA